MNSSTFSSKLHRRFVLGVLLLAFIPGAVLFCLGIYLQPLDGDLTRVGAYAERDFGWNAPQAVFKQAQYTSDEYTKGYDIVVLGDSFATAMPHHQWQNQVAVETGLSIVTLNSYTTSAEQILNNSVFTQAAPRFFVLTYAERHFPQRIGEQSACNASAPNFTASANGGVPEIPSAVSIPTISDPKVLNRQQHWGDWRDVKLAHAARHVLYGLVRAVFDREPSKALRVDLTRSDLFSNAQPSATLVFRDDVKKAARWKEEGLDELSCRIESLRQRVEANGITRFVLMVPPDKLTAYSSWANHPSYRSLSMLAELSRRHPLVMPRLDLALAAVIDAGHKDVYLPNNTHWGATGHLVAAQALTEFMTRLIQPRTALHHPRVDKGGGLPSTGQKGSQEVAG